MRKVLSILLAIICLAAYATVYSAGLATDISRGILRLHIIANSNSDYDQTVKYAVRDYVSEGIAKSSISAGEWEYYEQIEALAKQKLESLDAPYTAEIRQERVFIPKKSYKNITLPSGWYNAIRLVIGEGKGENWWCVAYPPLCFSESFSGEITPEAEEVLKSKMSSAAFEAITNDAEYRLWLVDFIAKWT